LLYIFFARNTPRPALSERQQVLALLLFRQFVAVQVFDDLRDLAVRLTTVDNHCLYGRPTKLLRGGEARRAPGIFSGNPNSLFSQRAARSSFFLTGQRASRRWRRSRRRQIAWGYGGSTQPGFNRIQLGFNRSQLAVSTGFQPRFQPVSTLFQPSENIPPDLSRVPFGSAISRR
jgi:hypothetical protein